jgi:hypothetical protein
MAADAKPEDYTDIEEENEEKGYQLPENAGVGDYFMYPWRSLEGFFERFLRNFGWKFGVQIAVMYLLVKGLMMSTVGLIKLSYCKKSLGIDGTACQMMGTIAGTPWAMKGAIGVLSDAYPLFGFHKASYIIVSAFLGTAAFAGLASLPITSAAVAACLLFCANLEIATADLLCEGKYAELMQTKPKTGSTMVSYVWGCFQVGSMIAACFVGPVADHYDPKILFWVLTPIAASIIIPTSLGYLCDERVPEDKAGFKTELIKQYPYIISFCLIMALCAVGNLDLRKVLEKSRTSLLRGSTLCDHMAMATQHEIVCILLGNTLTLPTLSPLHAHAAPLRRVTDPPTCQKRSTLLSAFDITVALLQGRF